MPIKLVGDDFEEVSRIDSGSFSLNRALRDRDGAEGMPPGIYEWFGTKSAGKTTTAIDLASLYARQHGTMLTLLDLEKQHKSTIMETMNGVGFDGDFNYMTYQRGEPPEKLLDRFSAVMYKEGSGSAVVDSIGAYVSKADLDGKLGDANMGVAPREMGKFAGRMLYAIQTDVEDRVIFLINHVHPSIGFMAHGHVTGGGEKKKYLSHVRAYLAPAFLGKHTIKYATGQLIHGRVENNRYGFPNGNFWLYIEYGKGIHRGLTSLWECIALKQAEVSAESITDATTVRLDGVKLGKIGEIITHANADDDQIRNIFAACHNKLLQSNVSIEDEQEEEE